VAALLAELRRLKQPLAARLETTAALEAGAGRLVIRHVAGDADLVARLARATNRQVLDEAVRRTWGPGVTWETRADLPPAADDRAEPETAPEIRDHPTVQTLLELFGGRIESVEEREEA
jgi:hypothetical protein